MANQSYAVTRNKKLLPNQYADLNARMAGLPNLMALQQQRRQYTEEKAFKEKQLAQEKSIADQELQFQEEQDKKAFGLEMTKLGVNVGTGLVSTKSVGEMASDFKTKFSKPQMPVADADAGMSFVDKGAKQSMITQQGQTMGTPGTPGVSKGGGAGSYFKALQPGSMLSGGLAGFGMGSMFSDKSSEKKLLFGAGAGLLTGMLSGGGLMGGLSGGIGGLFGGLVA